MARDSKQVLTELLVLEAQGGDEAAFRKLYELWSRDLRKLALVQLGKSQASDEVVQDAWVAIAKGLGKLDDPACFPRWAFRILDRRCVDWIRRAQRERFRTEALADGELNSEPARTSGVPGPVARISEAIAVLDAEGRTLLHLYYEASLSVSEIAEILGIPIGTVKSRLFALREKLKRDLERETL